MLAPAIYMLQVYDRVLSSGNETLLMLSIMVLGLFAFMGVLEWVRSLVVIRLGSRLDMQLNPRVFAAAFEASLAADGRGAASQALGDLNALRQFATGQALFAFFDAPWFPLYLLVMFMFSPWLLLALVGALALMALAWLNERVTLEPLSEAGRLSQLAGQQAAADLRNAEVAEAMGMFAALRQQWAGLHQGFLARQSQASERMAAITALSRSRAWPCSRWCWGWGWPSSS